MARMTVEQLVARLSPHVDTALRPLRRKMRDLEARAASLERENEKFRTKATNFGPLLARVGDADGGTHEHDMSFHYAARSGGGESPRAVNTFTQMLAALAAGGGRKDAALAWAGSRSSAVSSATHKALESGSDTAGGFLVPEVVSSEIIELLRAQSVVDRFRPRELPLDGNELALTRIDSGSTFSWIGQGQDVPDSEPTFGRVSLVPKKAASLVPVSNELLHRAPQAVEAVVTDDIVGDITAGVDLARIRGDGTGGQPAGLRNQPNIQTFASSGVTPVAIEDDVFEAIRLLRSADVRMIRPGWIIGPRTWKALFTARDSNGGNKLFPEMADGKIGNFPFEVTSAIPENLGGGGNESEVYFADFADVLIGTGRELTVDVSSQAAYLSGGSLVSAFSRDQTVVRVILETDLALRHGRSVVVITGVTWGA